MQKVDMLPADPVKKTGQKWRVLREKTFQGMIAEACQVSGGDETVVFQTTTVHK